MTWQRAAVLPAIVVAFIAALVVGHPVRGQLPLTGAGCAAASCGGGGGALTYTFTVSPTTQALLLGSNQATFPSVNIGTAASDRIVVAAISAEFGPVSLVTVCNNNMTLAHANTQTSNQQEGIWWLLQTTNATCNIVVNGSGTFSHVALSVGTITGSAAASVTSSGGLNPTGGCPPFTSSSVTVASGGVAVAVAAVADASAAISLSGVTQDVNNTTTSYDIGSGHNASAGTVTPAASTGICTTLGMAAAAWSP